MKRLIGLIVLVLLLASCTTSRVFHERPVETTPYDAQVWSFNCRHNAGVIRIENGVRSCCRAERCTPEAAR